MGAAFTLGFVLFAAGAGLQLLRWLGLRVEGSAERLSYGAAVGLGAAAYGVLGLGLVGCLSPGWIGALVLVVALLGAAQLGGWLRDSARALIDWARQPRGAADWAAFGLVLYCLTLALLTFVAAMAPPADLDWDGLTYHLAAPKIYLREHRIAFIPYDSHTNFPFTLEMLYALGLAWGDAPGAKLFHWAAGWLTAVAIAGWLATGAPGGRPLEVGGAGPDLDDRPPRPPWAPPLGAALWMSIPLAVWEAGTAYIDLATALFQFAALAAGLRSVRRDPAGQWTLDPRWALLAGLLSGWAMGTKYTALIQAGLLGLGLLLIAARAGAGQRRAAWGSVGLFGAAALLVALPWYVKNLLWTHNPVYPFLYPLFPNSVNWTMEFHRAYQAEQHSFGRGRDLVDFLRAPWDLAFHGRHFFITTQRRLQWDQWASLGILPIAFGPLLLFTRRVNWRALVLAGYALASGLLWWFLSEQSRYLLPVFAPLAAAAVVVILAVPDRLVRRVALGAAVASLAGAPVVAARIVGLSWIVFSGQVTRAEYLDLVMPDYYPTAVWANTYLPPTARVAFFQETRGFYFDRDYFWANPGQHNLIPYDGLESGDALVDYLKDHLGITHALVNLSLCRNPAVEQAPWWQLLLKAVAAGRLRPVYLSPRGNFVERRGLAVLELQ